MLFEHWRSNGAGARILITALAVASVFIQLSGLLYPATRYYQMVKYRSAHHQPEPWHGSLVIAQLEEFPTIVRNTLDFPPRSMKFENGSAGVALPSEEARIATMSAGEYLASFPNPINMACANLWLVKASKMGVPWPVAGALSLGLLASGVWLVCIGLRDPSLSE
jgi:hypothetical protein